MDKREVTKKLKKFAEVLKKNMRFKKMVLYGSYANGNSKPHSDIDVAIIVDNNDYDYFQSNLLMRQLRRDIDSRIEPMIFEEGNDPSGFLEDILKHGEVIVSN